MAAATLAGHCLLAVTLSSKWTPAAQATETGQAKTLGKEMTPPRSAQLGRLQMLISTHSFLEANDLLDQLCVTNPDDVDVRIAAAKLYREMGMLARSRIEYQQLASAYPSRVEPLIALSQMYLLYLDPRNALSNARNAVKLAPNNKDAGIALVSALVAGGNLKEADERLALLTRANSGDAEVHYVAYKLMMERGQLPEARHELENAIRIDPTNGQWLLDLSELCQLQHDYVEAKACLQRAINSDPNSLDKINKMAILQEYCFHDYDEARQQFQKILQIDPDSVSAIAGLDRCKAKENDLAAILKDQIRSACASTWHWLWSRDH
jgi:tetratricopeptide (TPR) repeat protein